MLTSVRLRQLWQNARYRQMLRQLLAGRPEAELGLEVRVAGPVPAAALALLRLGELRQSNPPEAHLFLEHVLQCQHRSGAWGQGPSLPICTALCVRGLQAVWRPCEWRQDSRLAPSGSAAWRLGAGQVGTCAPSTVPGMNVLLDQPPRQAGDEAIYRGIGYLAWAQAPSGEWVDGFTTAFILLQLGRIDAFRRAVRVGAALDCRRRPGQAASERQVWSQVSLRCGGALRAAAMQQASGFARQRPAPLFANVA